MPSPAAQITPVPDHVTNAVLQASRAIVALVARSLPESPDDVTLVQFRLLVVLRAHPGSKLGEVADALGVAPSTATRTCDRVVEGGFVRRDPGDPDRREIRLTLTDPGRRLVDRATRKRRRQLEQVLEVMPERERALLVPALEAFTDAAASTLRLSWPGADVLGDPEDS